MTSILNIDTPLFGAAQIFSAPVSTKGIRKVVMDGSRMRVLPFSAWMQFSWMEIRMLLHETATYVVPTEELICYLDELIGDEKAIEICAGNGYIGSELDIIMTDSYQQQDDKKTVLMYDFMKQPRIKYPKSVVKLEASQAVKRIRPHTVIGCYATHKWRDDVQSGNDKGVDFEDIYSKVRRIVLVGHKETHRYNPLMALPHKEIELPGLLTRAANQSLNRIFIWEH